MPIYFSSFRFVFSVIKVPQKFIYLLVHSWVKSYSLLYFIMFVPVVLDILYLDIKLIKY